MIARAGGTFFYIYIKSSDLFVNRDKESESLVHRGEVVVWYLERDRNSYHFGGGYSGIAVCYA